MYRFHKTESYTNTVSWCGRQYLLVLSVITVAVLMLNKGSTFSNGAWMFTVMH